MEITIRHTQDCPNVERAEHNVHEALRTTGRQARIRRELVSSADDAAKLGFPGSPTILIDGVDPFATPGASSGLACRLYQTPEGPGGAPSVVQLTDALERA